MAAVPVAALATTLTWAAVSKLSKLAVATGAVALAAGTGVAIDYGKYLVAVILAAILICCVASLAATRDGKKLMACLGAYMFRKPEPDAEEAWEPAGATGSDYATWEPSPWADTTGWGGYGDDTAFQPAQGGGGLSTALQNCGAGFSGAPQSGPISPTFANQMQAPNLTYGVPPGLAQAFQV